MLSEKHACGRVGMQRRTPRPAPFHVVCVCVCVRQSSFPEKVMSKVVLDSKIRVHSSQQEVKGDLFPKEHSAEDQDSDS